MTTYGSSARYEKLNHNTFGVRVAITTMLIGSNLQWFCEHYIPREIRDKFESAQWDGQYFKSDERWGRVRVTWKK